MKILLVAVLLLLQTSPFFSSEQKGQPEEFAPEEFFSEWGGSGFYQELDLPGAEREEVVPYRNRWMTGWGRAELKAILENGYKYRHYVKKRLAQEGLPSCLEYIPVIESSYKPLAKPQSGKSVGLWQFMENSIENYLRKTKWIDERRDPWKSTDAAIKKLKANHKQFGDWLLAIAAYNCGAGAVKRALKKSPQKTFWALAKNKLIPDHAIAYVPNLLAVCDLAQNAEYYKIDLPQAFYDPSTYSPLDDFDSLEVKQAISLKALANEMRVDEKLLHELNPALLYGVTPPDEEYLLRLPAGTRAAAEDAIFCIMLKGDFADN
ncbi:MAG: lytic transglycosylase domain-containing protein [Treponema sp.]|nr:lytic transglycosylase domain-containing protein [Treponema sp.]